MENENYVLELFKLLVDSFQNSTGRINFLQRTWNEKELNEYYAYLTNLIVIGEQYALFFPAIHIPLQKLKSNLCTKFREEDANYQVRTHLERLSAP